MYSTYFVASTKLQPGLCLCTMDMWEDNMGEYGCRVQYPENLSFQEKVWSRPGVDPLKLIDMTNLDLTLTYNLVEYKPNLIVYIAAKKHLNPSRQFLLKSGKPEGGWIYLVVGLEDIVYLLSPWLVEGFEFYAELVSLLTCSICIMYIFKFP